MLGLLLTLVIMAILTAVSLREFTGGGSTSVSNLPGVALATADATKALSIAQAVYASDQATVQNVTALQYNQEANTMGGGDVPTVTGGTLGFSGARFSFPDGTVVCVTTPGSGASAPATYMAVAGAC
jgi:hypothetical protein